MGDWREGPNDNKRSRSLPTAVNRHDCTSFSPSLREEGSETTSPNNMGGPIKGRWDGGKEKRGTMELLE